MAGTVSFSPVSLQLYPSLFLAYPEQVNFTFIGKLEIIDQATEVENKRLEIKIFICQILG